MNDLISVIIPIYNVEKYLEECLDSVLNQSYKNFEAILIDDGSKDNSGKICDEYVKKDSRFKVVHKENEGVSAARNLALDMANGKYITFLDSDDMLDERALSILYKEAKDNEADFVVTGWHDFKNDRNNIVCKCRKKKEILDSNKTMKFLLEEKYFQSVIWSKLYESSLLKEVRFDRKLVIAEDLDFLYKVLKKVKRAVLNTEEIIYYYRVREDSAMRTKYNSKFENEISITEKILEDIQLNNVQLENSAIKRYQRINVSCIDKYFRENLDIKGVEHLKDNLKKYKINLSFRHYVKMILLLHCRLGLKIIYKLMGKI